MQSKNINQNAGGFIEGAATGLTIIGWLAVIAPFIVLAGDGIKATSSAIGEILNSPSPTEALYIRWWPMAAWGANTLIVCAVSVLLALTLGTPIAFLICKTNLRGGKAWWLLLAVLAFTPLYITATSWVNLFGQPAMTSSAEVFFGFRLGEGLVKNISAGIIMGFAYFPLAAFIIASGFASIPRELDEAALLDGGGLHVLLRIDLPLAVWSISAAAVLIAILSATEIAATNAVMARTYAEQIYQSFQIDSESGRAVLVSLPLIITFLAGCRYIGKRFAKIVDSPLLSYSVSGKTFSPRGLSRIAGFSIMMLIAIASLYPLTELAIHSFSDKIFIGRTIPAYLDEQLELGRNSIPVAMAGAALAVFLAASCAWWLRRKGRQRIKRLVWGGLLLILAMPTTVLAVGMIRFWNGGFWETFAPAIPRTIYDTQAVLAIFYATRALPLAVIIFWSAFRGIPENVFDSARLDGANNWTSLRRIALPMNFRATVAAFFVTYVVSLSEVGGSIILQRPGMATFSVKFVNQVHNAAQYGDLGRTVFSPLILTLMPGLVLFLAFKLFRKNNQ